MTLLKNGGGLLPLHKTSNSTAKTVLVVGEWADSLTLQSGGWTWQWQGSLQEASFRGRGVSFLKGIKGVTDQIGWKVNYFQVRNAKKKKSSEKFCKNNAWNFLEFFSVWFLSSGCLLTWMQLQLRFFFLERWPRSIFAFVSQVLFLVFGFFVFVLLLSIRLSLFWVFVCLFFFFFFFFSSGCATIFQLFGRSFFVRLYPSCAHQAICFFFYHLRSQKFNIRASGVFFFFLLFFSWPQFFSKGVLAQTQGRAPDYAQALAAAATADYIIAVIGERPYAEMLNNINDLNFSPAFDQAIAALKSAAGKPLILVMVQGPKNQNRKTKKKNRQKIIKKNHFFKKKNWKKLNGEREH